MSYAQSQYSSQVVSPDHNPRQSDTQFQLNQEIDSTIQRAGLNSSISQLTGICEDGANQPRKIFLKD